VADATHGPAHGAEHGAEAAGQAGLPQLDPSFFPSQLFWLTIFFVLLYLLLDRALLPRVGGMIDARAKRIRDDVDAAAKANADAQASLVAYDTAIATARAQSRQTLEAARAEASDVRARQSAEAEGTLSERLGAAEARLSQQRAAGLASAQAAGEAVARDIVSRLTGQAA
jgi:F-type H+-transporting ATPase subunit b